MTKRLISLLLALVMLLSLCMTSCAGGEEEEATGEAEEEVQRKNIALTIYAITDEKTTPEGLAAVEEKISNYCVAKYKTAIDLRFVTEEEYQKSLDDMYVKFDELEAEAKRLEAEQKKKAKEEAAYKATLSPEEKKKYEQEKRMEKKRQEEEAKKKAEEEAELIEQGKDVAVLKDVQMDIIYVPGATEYYQYIKDGALLDLTAHLNGVYKNIKDYVFPSFMTAATVDGMIYGVPNNQGITTNETYFVVNKALAEKYNVDWTKVRSITDLESVFAQVRANDGVPVIAGDFDPEGLVFCDDMIDMAGTSCVFYDTLLGGRYNTDNAYSAYNPKSAYGTAMVDYCELKYKYRSAGYLSDAQSNFFLSVKELSEAEKKEWQDKGYLTVLYKGAEFTTEAALDCGLFGISKYCEAPERAMEIIQLLTTDPDFRNLFAFGVEDVNYIKTAGEENVITIVDDSYSMDFFKSGNALIGYVPDAMGADALEKAKTKNLNSRLDPFLGFRYDWTDATNKKFVEAFPKWKEGIQDRVAKLHYGTADYMAILTELYDELYNNPEGKYETTFKSFQNDCTFRGLYKSYTSKLVALDQTLHIEDVTYNPIAEEAPAETPAP